MNGWRFAAVAQAATLGIVYRKSLRISQQGLAKVSVGHITNLITNDSERFMLGCIFIYFIVIAPVILLVGLWLLWQQVGWPAIFGPLLLALLAPLYVFLGRLLKRLRLRTAKITDERVKKVRTPVLSVLFFFSLPHLSRSLARSLPCAFLCFPLPPLSLSPIVSLSCHSHRFLASSFSPFKHSLFLSPFHLFRSPCFLPILLFLLAFGALLNLLLSLSLPPPSSQFRSLPEPHVLVHDSLPGATQPAIVSHPMPQMNEFLKGMRVIKMNAWETPLHALIKKIRAEELSAIRKTNFIRAFTMSLYFMSPIITSFVILLPYSREGNTLTNEKVFLCIALFNAIRFPVSMGLPNSVQVRCCPHNLPAAASSCG